MSRRRAAIDEAVARFRRQLIEALVHADAAATDLGATAAGSPFALRVAESPRCDVSSLRRLLAATSPRCDVSSLRCLLAAMSPRSTSPRCDVPALEGRCGVRVEIELDGPARLSELRFDTLRLDGTRYDTQVVGLERGSAIERDANRRLSRGSHVVWVARVDREAPLLRVRAVRGGTR